jgi:PAS domain S-box-containing protein
MRKTPPADAPLVLIVDDTPTSIELLAHFLRGQYRVALANGGARALELAEAPEQPDLILLDIMMPGMDGFEVCRRLKENPATRDIPVIFITALDSMSDQLRGFSVGAVDYLHKPLLLDAVRARVALHLNLHRQQRELERYRRSLEDQVAERTAELEATNRELSETLFAMDRVGIAIHWVDAETGRFLYVNEATCAMTGYSQAELMTMVVGDIDPNVPRQGFAETTRGSREQVAKRLESVHRCKDGRLIPVEVVVHYRVPVPGETGRFIAFASDITERRAAEQAAEQARRLLQEAVESVAQGFTVYDQDDRLMLCNEAHRQFYASSRNLRVPGARFEDIVREGVGLGQYAEAAGQAEAWLEQRLAQHRRADGTPVEQRLDDGRWLQLIQNRTASGYIVATQTDITDLKRVTEDLERHRTQLEALVAKRTEQLRHLAMEASLSEERERQAIARDLHDDLGQLLHVLRIKLDSLLPAVPRQARGALGELAGMVVEASRTVRSLSSQLSPPILAELGLVPALVWLAEEMAGNYGLEVEVESDQEPKRLDPAKAAILFRAVRELLINVAKHAAVGWARVGVRGGDEALEIVVEDGGIGITNQEEAMMGRRGLGLSSVRERIAYLGGSLEVRSTPGVGTAVLIRMPLEEGVP